MDKVGQKSRNKEIALQVERMQEVRLAEREENNRIKILNIIWNTVEEQENNQKAGTSQGKECLQQEIRTRNDTTEVAAGHTKSIRKLISEIDMEKSNELMQEQNNQTKMQIDIEVNANQSVEKDTTRKRTRGYMRVANRTRTPLKEKPTLSN